MTRPHHAPTIRSKAKGATDAATRSTSAGGNGIRLGYEYMNPTKRRSGMTCKMSPVSNTPRPSAPAGQCATVPPAK
jgi:hypothetical protein